MDVWKIGVAISMTNGVSPVLTQIASQVLGLNANIKAVQTGFAGWGEALKGAAAIMAGGILLDGVAKMVEHGRDLVHVQQQLSQTGTTQIETAAATGRAWETAIKYGLRVSDVLADIKEAQMVFGSTEHAMDFIDPLEKMRVVLNATAEGSGAKMRDAVYDMAKSAELKGLITPDAMVSYFDGMTKAIVASGGKVDPAAYLQATKYGRIASKGWDEDFYTKYLPSIIQEQGASSAGTALSALYGTLVQGKVSKRSLQMLDDLGLIADKSLVTYNKLGDPVGMKPGAIAGSDIMTRNPFEWAQTILNPLLTKKFGAFQPGDPKILDWIGGAFGNRLAAQDAATLTMEGVRINKDAGLITRAQTGTDNLFAKDPTTAINNFKNSWDNLLTSFGVGMVAPAVTGMNMLAGAMKGMTALSVAHPDAAKGVVELMAAMGVAATAWGAVKVGQGVAGALGYGPLMGSATALTGSAAALTNAAIALGGAGVTSGVGGAAGARAAGGGWMGNVARVAASLPFIAYAVTKFAEGSQDVANLAHGWGGVNVGPRGISPANGRIRNPWEAGQPGADTITSWRDELAKGFASFHSKLNQIIPAGSRAAPSPPPVINVTAPPPATMTGNVILNGSIIGQISAMITKAAAGLGMPSGPPTPNNRALVPTVDSSGGGGGGGF